MSALDRMIIAAHEERAEPAVSPYSFARDLACHWAGRHGSLKGALYCLEIELRHGNIDRAMERVSEALERDDASAEGFA